MIHLRTGSRLHFGLFNPGTPGSPRRFGGVGLMIDDPGIELEAVPASAWSATGPLAGRVLQFIDRIRARWQGELHPLAFTVRRAAEEHVGLGTGTQLGLAVARAIQLAHGHCDTTATELARLSGRGERSALGVHGFMHGGFLVEGGQSPLGGLSPLLARVEWPEEWHILLIRPTGAPGIHGDAERQAFQAMQPEIEDITERLCRLTLLGMLPALAERDLKTFGEALFEFNARAGEWFKAAQGGTYAGREVQDVVERLRRHGTYGVGQSSWGPTVFAVVEADKEAAIGQEMAGKCTPTTGRNHETKPA